MNGCATGLYWRRSPLFNSQQHWLAWGGLRLVVAHDPVRAAEQTQRRRERIATLLTQGESWAGKLDGQEAGIKHKGRKLSESGAKARFFHAVSEAHLSRIIKVDLKAELFCYEVDEHAAADPISGVSTLQDDQSEILRALNVKKPAAQQQLALL